jgi:hypothetical protein
MVRQVTLTAEAYDRLVARRYYVSYVLQPTCMPKKSQEYSEYTGFSSTDQKAHNSKGRSYSESTMFGSTMHMLGKVKPDLSSLVTRPSTFPLL